MLHETKIYFSIRDQQEQWNHYSNINVAVTLQISYCPNPETCLCIYTQARIVAWMCTSCHWLPWFRQMRDAWLISGSNMINAWDNINYVNNMINSSTLQSSKRYRTLLDLTKQQSRRWFKERFKLLLWSRIIGLGSPPCFITLKLTKTWNLSYPTNKVYSWEKLKVISTLVHRIGFILLTCVLISFGSCGVEFIHLEGFTLI